MDRFLILFIAFLSTGCTLSPDTDDRLVLRKELKEFCGLLMVDTDAGIKRLLKSYGKPDSISVETIPNKHDPDANDEVHMAIYKDGQVVIYSVPHMRRNYLLKVILTDKFWPDFLSRHIGKSKQEVVEYFGKPDRLTGNDFVYHCSMEADQFIKLHMRKNQVAKLEIKGWVD